MDTTTKIAALRRRGRYDEALRLEAAMVERSRRRARLAPPTTSDARAWDDWRRRLGYAGDHH